MTLRIRPDADDATSVDDLFTESASIHIERMSATHYWIGITDANGTTIHVDIVSKRRIKAHVRQTMTASEPRTGTCQNCRERVQLDANGYICFHSWPKPTRRVCPGSKHSPQEDMDAALVRAGLAAKGGK